MRDEFVVVPSQDAYGMFTLCFAPEEETVAPRVSVLMPVRNGERFLAESLQSVLRQTFSDFEVLVADDGSTDETLDELRRYAALDRRIRVVSQPNMGLTKTLNRLLGLARGDYIARQDADDIWLEDKLARQVDFLDTHPDVILLGTRYRIIDSAGNLHGAPSSAILSDDAALREALGFHNPFMHASVLMRRDRLTACEGYDDTYKTAQDYELWLRLREKGRLEMLPEVHCLRRETVDRRSLGKSREQRRNVLRAKIRHGVITDFRHAVSAMKDACAGFLPPVILNGIYAVRSLLFFRIGKSRSSRGTLPCRILFCSVRADWGGGPEHLFQLLAHAPDCIRPYLACPQDDEPYSALYRKIAGAEHCMHIPHRSFSPRAFVRLLVFTVRNDIALMHSHGKGAGLYTRFASLITGIPCVHTYHGVHIGEYKPVVRHLYFLLERCFGRFSFRNIAVSETEARMVRALGFSAPERLDVIENGVSIPEKPVPLCTRPPYPVVHISRFDFAKHTEFVLDVAKELDRAGKLGEFRFLLIGDGAGRIELEKAVAGCGYTDNIEFVGFTRGPQRFFPGALCYFSCSRWEGLPLALLEAQAAGLPVVASRVRGNVDAVRDGVSGLLFEPESAPDAVERLLDLAADRGFAERLGRQAKADVQERFDVRMMARKTFAILREGCM